MRKTRTWRTSKEDALRGTLSSLGSVVVLVVVIRGDIELDGRETGDLEVAAALGAAQLIALVDLEFVDFDFCITFRARRHSIS